MASILCVNAGSSSLKASLYQAGQSPLADPVRLVRAEIDRIGHSGSTLSLTDGRGNSRTPVQAADVAAALAALLAEFATRSYPRPDAVGHRLVHGGPHHVAHALLTPSVLEALRGATSFAPLHLPAELSLIGAISAALPNAPQVACFDTAFHQTLPETVRHLPLPEWVWDAGIRRYGFHGLSYESVVHGVGAGELGRAVVAHLGSGASLAAIVDGCSVDTTMGLTPTGGIVMGTRSGDLDPGVLIHLAREHRLGPDALEKLLDHESGLTGLAGRSDMRELLERAPSDARAHLAIEVFCRSVQKAIGAFAAVLGGLDTLVFTGGIGEHAAPIRAQICAQLGFLGIALDVSRNEAHAATISIDGPCRVRVMPADEELMMARHVARLARI